MFDGLQMIILRNAIHQETLLMSHDQLVAEVECIYVGLVTVETKYIDVDREETVAAQEQDSTHRSQRNNERWHALIALHRALLHEQHDFFLASQHPLASPALSRLASKHSIPVRMRRHGNRSFLEALRHRLPKSLDHMLAFIYIAFHSMMTLLNETAPFFEDTWMECLGDLVRYRMAIGNDNTRDREVWSEVARLWYSRAAETYSRLGRHSRYVTRSLLDIQDLKPADTYQCARNSILALFNSIDAK